MLPAALAVLCGCGSVTPGRDEAQRPPDGPPAPDFTGGGAWINTAPLTLEELRGRVVLVDFWTYGCYNCQNTLPAMRDWWATYKDRGLMIVGVHTPEFEHERDLENVRAAVRRAQITWPVVQDNEMRIWRAYRNHYWPHFYLVDHRGRIVYDRIGEGAYDITERRIADALAARPTA
jgi:thiol-disulfide isomerase/thioredoxin